MQHSFATQYLMRVSSCCVLTIVLLFLDQAIDMATVMAAEEEEFGNSQSWAQILSTRFGQLAVEEGTGAIHK